MKALSIILTVILLHTQLAVAAGCDLPMFGGARMFEAVSSGTSLATGDFNQDGFIDVVVGDGNTGGPVTGVSVLLGNGDGTFQPPIYYPFPNGVTDVVVADFNGDGKPDLAVAAGSLLVMLGNGDGTFKAGINTGARANLMAVGDFNGDGKPDLVTSENVTVLLGKGDGTFQAAISAATSSAIPFGGLAVGDFNGDGKLDVVAPSASGSVLVLLGDGTGKLGAPTSFNTGETFPGKLSVGDLNGDHKLDVVSLNALNNDISVLLGNGNGTFQAPTNIALGGNPDSAFGVVIADLNGDGYPDLAVANVRSFTAAGSTISVFPGNGDGTFGAPVQYDPVGQPIYLMVAGDFNGDGLPDLVFASEADTSPSQVGVIFGAANFTLQSPASYAVGLTPGPPVLADLNGDGVLDLVVAPSTGSSGNVSVLLGYGDGSFQPAVSFPAAAGAQSVAVGDFNGDGKPDLIVSTFSLTTFLSNLLVFLGNGDGTFQAPIVTTSPISGTTPVVVGDFNKDGKLDVLAGGQIWLGNGNGTFRATSTFVGGLVVADMNGDGNLDVVGTGGGGVLVQLGNGDGTFQAPVSYHVGSTGLLTVGDLNGDGKPDVVVVSVPNIRPAGSQLISGTIAVLLNNGDGTLQPAVTYGVGEGVYSVSMGDFNGDGKTDLAVIDSFGVTVLLGNGDGTFRNPLTYGAAKLYAAVGDVNGDGKPDLVTVDDTDDGVAVLLNTYIPGSGGSACATVQPFGN